MAIIVTASTLRTQAEELRTLNSTFRNTVNDLTSTEQALNSMWEGDANNAFHNAYTRDSIQMSNFYNAIEVYVNALLNIVAQYEQAEAINTETATTRSY